MAESEISPERERQLVFNSMNRRHRRLAKKQRPSQFELPDLMPGLSNRQRMTLKKLARGGRETSRRRQRKQD